MDAEMKLARAKTKLTWGHPFFGSIALTCRWVADDSIGTMATDGVSILYDPKFVEEMDEEILRGVIAHEVMHIVMKHCLRRGDRDPKKWNIAADYVINDIILEAGFNLPDGVLIDKSYHGMTAEQAYARLPDGDDQPDQPSWGMVMDAKGEDGAPMSGSEADALEAEIDRKVMVAADTAKSIGKLPASIEGIVKKMRKPQVDWRQQFSRFIGGEFPFDYTQRRINRRIHKATGFFAPSIEKFGAGDIVIGIDTSGSVSSLELEHFLGELNAIAEEHKPDSVTVITCDSKVQTVERFEQGDDITAIKLGGRGGTRVTPVFDYIEDNDMPCDNFVYLSDMEVDDFPDAPDYPVMWVSTGSRFAQQPPFGEIATLEIG